MTLRRRPERAASPFEHLTGAVDELAGGVISLRVSTAENDEHALRLRHEIAGAFFTRKINQGERGALLKRVERLLPTFRASSTLTLAETGPVTGLPAKLQRLLDAVEETAREDCALSWHERAACADAAACANVEHARAGAITGLQYNAVILRTDAVASTWPAWPAWPAGGKFSPSAPDDPFGDQDDEIPF